MAPATPVKVTWPDIVRLVDQHPRIAAGKFQTDATRGAVKTAGAAPNPSLDGTIGHGRAQTGDASRMEWGVTLPVWNWNGGGIAQAEAKLAAGRKQVEAMSLDLETTVIEAQAACKSSVLTAARLGRNMVPRSETVASVMERTYQLGEASLLEVIDSRRTLLDSKRLYLSALAQAQIECARLGVLVREELP